MASLRSAAPAMLALAATLALLSGTFARSSDYCYVTEGDPYLDFASKTAYEFVRARPRGPDTLTHCTPLQVWWVNRHGTRYPGISTIRNMQNLASIRDTILSNHREGTGRLCDADLEKLTQWRLNVNESLENRLTKSGEEEVYLTARRLRARFPAVLELPYTSARYKFRHTDSQRTEQSAREFANGLFESSAAVHIPPALKEDMLLQPYTSCKVWLDRDKTDPQEWRKLVDGSMMASLVANVSSRLGYRGNLKYDDVNTIYDMCRYDKAWNVGLLSHWCVAFSKEELKFLEYAEDLRYYYKSGYGDDMNVKLGCPLAKDLIEHFKAVASGSSEHPAGVFYFTHSSALHMLQARLGVFRDPRTLLADNYFDQRHRVWRVSKMGSFAANIGAIFYRCTPPGEPESKKVLFLSGEGTLEVQGCSVGLCAWEHVRNLLEPLAQQCNLEWCRGRGGAAVAVASWPALLLALFAAIACSPLRRAM